MSELERIITWLEWKAEEVFHGGNSEVRSTDFSHVANELKKLRRETTSTQMLEMANNKFKELERKGHEERSFICGYIEGFTDCLRKEKE